MDSKKLRIPLSRFLPDKLMAGDVFLRLPLNKKSLRIVCSGEALGEPLLARLHERGHTHLEVIWDETRGTDADTYPIYLDASMEPGGVNLKLGLAKEAEESGNLEVLSSGEMGSRINAKNSPEDIAGIQSANGDNQSFAELELDAHTAAGKDLAGLASSIELSEVALEANAEIRDNNLKNFSGEESDSASKIKGSAEEDSESDRISSDESDDNDSIQIRSGRKEKEERTLVKGSAAAEEVKIFKISAGAGEEEQESVIIRLGEKLETAKEMLLNGQAYSLAQNKDEILRDMKNSILVSKIAEKIVGLRGNDSASEEVVRLAEIMRLVEGGNPPEPETLERFGIIRDLKKIESILTSEGAESEKVIALSEKMAEYARNREEVQTEVDAIEERKATSTSSRKENPNVVGKLASYLGYSLGYTSQTYLRDLSLGALVRISSSPISDDTGTPPFVRTITEGKAPTSAPECDGLEILTFLEFYFKEPGLDLSQGDFSKKAFESTLHSMKDQGLASPWNMMCWEKFINSGPTLESHSLCSKASAQALKMAKSANATA